MKTPVPVFKGFSKPTSDFPSVRSELRAPPMYRDISLASARSLANGTAEVLTLAGNVLYIDQKANSGYAVIHVQDDASVGNTPITVFPGFLARLPFTQIILENDAQPGMVLRIIYGTDMDFEPVPGGGVSILNAININDTIDPVCQFANVAMPVAIAANVVTPIFLPAANPRGVVLRELYHNVDAGGGGTISSLVFAAAVAPVSGASAPNQVALSVLADTGVTPILQNVTLNRRIPAGWGVWVVSSITAAVATSHAVALSYEAL